MMTWMLTLAIALYGINSVLLAVLAYVYGRTALSTKAKYPLGLFIFSILLLLHSVGTAGAYLLFNDYFGAEVQPFMSLMASFELVGVVAMIRITL